MIAYHSVNFLKILVSGKHFNSIASVVYPVVVSMTNSVLQMIFSNICIYTRFLKTLGINEMQLLK